MKFSIPFLAIFVTIVSAVPTQLAKRATVNDVADIGYATLNGGTTGGSGGAVTTVETLAELTAAVAGDVAKVIIVSGTIDASSQSSGVAVKVGGNTSILGASGAKLINVGLRVIEVKNVIIRGLTIQKVRASTDAIAVQEATNVWIDHNDLSSDMEHSKDYYDGLLDITHAGDFITVSYNFLHDHWKTSLVGHSDNNGDEDTFLFRITYHHNYFKTVNSRTPSFRFGTGHLFNNYIQDANDGINTRQGAQLLIENNVFSGTPDAIYSTDSGYAVATGNDFGAEGENTAPVGTFTADKVPYKYTLDSTSSVVSTVTAGAGAKVSFSA